MQWKSLLALALIAPYSSAILRFPCSQLVTQRFDPLVNPGKVSPHLHQIVGGNAFNITMNPLNDLRATSTCTTCRFKEDTSNYWTAVMFFKHPNGTYTRVGQIPGGGTGSPVGGMTVYYVQPPSGKVTAFKKGFRMIVGDPFVRNGTYFDPKSPQAKALTYRCLPAPNDIGTSAPGTGPLDSVALPNKVCPGGIRSNIFFPSCWDGVNLDSENHHDHVAYPVGTVPDTGLFYMQGTCPSTHPVRIPLLFMETVWDTKPFNSMFPKDGTQPFVFSQGDPTGYGQHADYVFGWQDDSLQRAMDTCTDASGVPTGCRALTTVTDNDINTCLQQNQVPETLTGYLSALPGCNPLQDGPSPASPISNCNAVSTTIPVPSGAPPPVTGAPPPPITTAPPVGTPPPSTTAPTAPMQTHYGQCGGASWQGATTCQPPYTCKAQNQYYSQCT